MRGRGVEGEGGRMKGPVIEAQWMGQRSLDWLGCREVEWYVC